MFSFRPYNKTFIDQSFSVKMAEYCVADIPGMGCYFFSYEWILSKITLEGERYTQYTEVISPHPLEILP